MQAVIPDSARSGYGRTLERHILRHILAGPLLRPGEDVLVAVSGGPDSVTLLAVLHHLAMKLQIKLGVAHLDHALRHESAAEAQQVMALVEAAGIPFWSERRETPDSGPPMPMANTRTQGRGHRPPSTLSGCGEGPAAAGVRSAGRRGTLRKQPPEETLRIARYDFLARTAKQEGFTVVASGHHADDQAETVLLRLVRGAGGKGLRAMSPRSSFPSGGYGDLSIVRPLLDTTRAQIELYCEREELPVLRDPSNTSPDFTRNRIRHEVLPLLSSINPAAGAALGRAARSLARDEDYLESETLKVWFEGAVVSANAIKLDSSLLIKAHPAVQVRVLRRAAQQMNVPLQAEESEKLLRLVTEGRGHLDLDVDVAVDVAIHEVVFRRSPLEDP